MQRVGCSRIRTLSEHLFRGLTFTKHLHDINERLHVSTGVGGLKYLFKPFSRLDPNLTRIASRLVSGGSIVWDVGANVGLFSVYASHHSGPSGSVYSFECDNSAVSLLTKTSRGLSSKCSKVSIIPIAISSSVSIERLAVSARSSAVNALEGFGSSQITAIREHRYVPTFTLDSLLELGLPAPNVLKVDIEGAEYECLSCSTTLLARYRPVIYCEVSDANSYKVAALLRSHNYHLYDVQDYLNHKSIHLASCTRNIVAIPS